MILCATVYWICHSICWISSPRLCFIAFKMISYYPVPSHFQFSGRDGSGTWKKVRNGSGTGIPSDPAYEGTGWLFDEWEKVSGNGVMNEWMHGPLICWRWTTLARESYACWIWFILLKQFQQPFINSTTFWPTAMEFRCKSKLFA